MPHLRVIASIDVNQAFQEQVAAAFQGCLDDLALQGLEIYNSEISCVTVTVTVSDDEDSDRPKRKKKRS